MPGDPWRAYLRDHHHSVLRARKQSLAFLAGERLGAIPLKHNTKIQVPGEAGLISLEDWVNVDLPAQINLAARFSARTPQVVGADIDADWRPLDRRWTKERLLQVRHGSEMIFTLIRAIGGIQSPHLWGRESRGHWGHLYLPVHVENKEGLARLLSLSMKKPVIIGEFSLRIEVRCAPDTKAITKKPFTLPGSVYPHPLDAERFDLLQWQLQPEHLPEAFEPRPPEPVANLAKGLWAALLGVSLAAHWGEGARHDIALLAAGVLARETIDEGAMFDADSAREAMRTLCAAFHDDEINDRLQVFDNSLRRLQAGDNVTGYPRLAELVGDDVKLALLRLRGGTDPELFDNLLAKIAYAKLASGRPDVYLDFSTGPHGAVVCDQQALVRHFHPHADYPSIVPPKGKPIPLIRAAIESKRLPRYESALDLPGIPFGTVMIKDREDYREATEDERIDPTTLRHVNIGPGFATELVPQPIPLAELRWRGLWGRHLIALTNNNAAAMVKLDQAIAWAVKHPLEKIPLGLCLTGDGGIGKSATFNVILPAVLGNVIGYTNVLGLEGQFRLHDLEGKLFYVIEEVNLGAADLSLKELLKDLMKNPKFDINRKYGAKGTIANRAIPVFLTNERDPNIVIAGQPERSLVLIQGMTRENQGMTVEEWRIRRDELGDDVAEFVAALRDQEVREAAMHYFMTTEVQRSDFNDNFVSGMIADPYNDLEPMEQAICAMLQDGQICSKLRHSWALRLPFKTEWLVYGIEEHLRERGLSRRSLTAKSALKVLRRMLGGDHSVERQPFRDAEGKVRQLNYITMRYGDMIAAASRKAGFELEPEYHLTDADFGPNEVTQKECQGAWETTLVNNNGY